MKGYYFLEGNNHGNKLKLPSCNIICSLSGHEYTWTTGLELSWSSVNCLIKCR